MSLVLLLLLCVYVNVSQDMLNRLRYVNTRHEAEINLTKSYEKEQGDI